MDGRWKRWAVAGVLAAGAVGCNRQAVKQADPVTLGPAAQSPSLFGRVLGSKSNSFPQPPAEPVVVKERRKADAPPFKPETEVAFADTAVQAAALDRPATERDQLLDTARQRYQKVLASDPKNKAALLGLAKMYAVAGDKDQSVATFRTALKYYPKDHALAHQMAAVQARFDDWAGAAESCRLALAQDPENRIYHKTLGVCLAHQERWDEALASLGRAMPEAQARYYVGRVLIDMNRLDEAKRFLQEAVSLDPQFAAAKHVLDDLTAGKVNTAAEPVVQAGFDPAAAAGAVQPASER